MMTAGVDVTTGERRDLIGKRMVRFILLTEGDPWQEAHGGQTAFAHSLLTAFADEIAVACHGNDRISVGEWSTRDWQGRMVPFFNLGPLEGGEDSKPLIPRRIICWYAAGKYIRKIRALCNRCLVDNPEQFFPAAKVGWESLVYLFSGVSNPVAHSRYKILRPLGKTFESRLVRRLIAVRPSVYLAAASTSSIQEFSRRIGNLIPPERIHSFPTRVDQTIFHPCQNREAVRSGLKMAGPGPHLVVVGRLCRSKGWELLLQAFALFRKKSPDARLYFLGNGEDRAALEESARDLRLQDAVSISGFIDRRTVAAYLGAADLYLCASFYEGWSVAMCEALACGCTIVSTVVSGASDMVVEGRNGFLVKARDAGLYAEAMEKALQLPDAGAVSLELSKRYRTDQLRSDLLSLWKEIRSL